MLRHEKCFHNVLCLSEAKGMDIKMNVETELARLTKENELFKKIIEIQENTIKKMVDYFILEEGTAPAPDVSKNI